ncbi:MAG: penicillin-binding transpeptidase domain-containing protein [Clostridiales bacterium]|nr:penicillin-binding transpeptidase domain-containing protein [Clostridiales bacterium]
MATGKTGIRRRIAITLIIILLAFLAIISRLFMIQLVQASELQEKAENDRIHDMPVLASRGAIYDRKGNKLAISIIADSISASPPHVKNSGQAEEIAEFLASTLDMDKQKVLDDITSNSLFSWVKRKVDFQVADTIRQAHLPGINIIGEPRRYYPKGMLAANIIGYAGMDHEGLEGLEIKLEHILRGKAGRIIGEYDANGHLLQQAKYDYLPASDGYDVYLTIDENIQYFCERELDKLMISETAPKSAGIIMMRPDTAEILALAQRNSYDPNYFNTADAAAQRNVLVSDSYEPGSTFKIITAAAALEEGTATLESHYHDSGYINVAGIKINCWRAGAHGNQSFTEVMQNSCNPALVAIGQGLESKEKGLFYKYIRAFGFGEPTGVELPGEAQGILQSKNNLGPVEIATTCIGQGISVTPIQMITAVCAVANGGKLMKPQIVYQIKDGDEIIEDFKPKMVRQVISAETAETLRGVLENVATNGTGRRAYIEGYRVAGKTGTAQKPGGGGYLDGKYVASFVGMAPANNPQIACIVFVDEPALGYHQGSAAAAPLFAVVVEDTMRYLGVVPQITASGDADNKNSHNQQEKTTTPDLRGLSAVAAREVLALSGLHAELLGVGDIVSAQTPAAFVEVNVGATVIVTLKGNLSAQVIVPDLTGKRLSAAAEMLSALGLKLSAEGSGGLAYEQNPATGTLLNAGGTVNVKFAAPQ